jgi:hypothetical protein
MDVSELQAKYKEVLGVETISRNKEVLIEQIRQGRFSKDIREKRAQRKKAAGAKAEAETPTMTQRLEDWTTEDLQRELNVLTGRRALERDRAVLIRMITKLRQQKQDKLEAKAGAETPTITQRLVAIANMKLPELREEYRLVFGKPSLSRNRKALLVRIAEKLQADAAGPESPTGPVAKPTLTVKFERRGGKKAGGKAKGHAKAKAAAEAKETATAGRTTRRPGQRDPRLPKVGTTIERVYKGKKLLVTVTEEGFTFSGKPYRSLSALAMAITGAKAMNGYLFFCLGKYAKKEKAGK